MARRPHDRRAPVPPRHTPVWAYVLIVVVALIVGALVWLAITATPDRGQDETAWPVHGAVSAA